MVETDTRCSRLIDEAEASSFKLRSKEEVEAELRRALKAKVERRGQSRLRRVPGRRWRGGHGGAGEGG